MRSRTLPSRRDGFTLIELLVVVSILAVLAAMTMAGISRVRASQNKATTEGTVTKLQKGLNQQFTATMDQATGEKNDYLPLVQQFADGDKDRAKAILCYLASKREFPQTFMEARNTLPSGALSIPGLGGFPANKVFAGIPGGSYAPDVEAANLLYIIVHDKASRGTTIDADGSLAGAEMITPTTGLKAFKDAYGTHIAFIRWYGPYNGPAAWPYIINQDTQNAPFANTKIGLLDPFDRLGTNGQAKLGNWNNAGAKTLLFNVLNQNYSAPFAQVQFDGFNKIMTVVSAGPDKVFGNDDDIYGYPLARLGAKGD